MEYNLCKEFGWTVQELYSQPVDFIYLCVKIINARHNQEIKSRNRSPR